MKRTTSRAVCALSMFLALGLAACDEAVKDLTRTTVPVEKSIYDSETVTGEATVLFETDGSTIQGTGGKKDDLPFLPASGFIELTMSIPDVVVFTNIVSAGQANFAGTLTNNVANDATFGIYFSTLTGESDPQSTATPIATLTVPASSSVTITGLADFDQGAATVISNILAFLTANPGVSPIYVYLTADGEPEINVTITSMAFSLPPNVHLKKVVEPGDLADYAERIEDLSNTDMTGTVLNSGSAQVEFAAFLSVVTGGFVSGDPAPTDSIAYLALAPGETANLETAPSFLLPGGAAKMESGVMALIGGNDIEFNLFFTSTASTNLTLTDVGIKSSATVTL